MNGRIFVNGRFLDRRLTGVERYAGEVLHRLLPEVTVIRPARALPPLPGHLWEQVRLPRKLAERDVLWSPANTGPLLLDRQVVTVHDLGPIEQPKWFRPAFVIWYRMLIPGLIRRARIILTSSVYFRNQISSRFGVRPEKVRVANPGVNQGIFYPRQRSEVNSIRNRLSISGRYLLAVGSLNPRKNLARLVEAWQAGGFVQEGHALVVVGLGGAAFPRNARSAPPPGVIYVGFVEDEALAALYSGASAFVFPSLYEGFGLPVLEAMACGTPVLASSRAAIPEACGDSALLFDPTDVGAILQALRTGLSGGEGMASLREKGFARAGAFRWEKTRDRVWEALQEARELR